MHVVAADHWNTVLRREAPPKPCPCQLHHEPGVQGYGDHASRRQRDHPGSAGRLCGLAGVRVVTVGLGTPAVPRVLLMDTGSDLSWVQCAPCNSTACYPQKNPLFDPSKSSTYAPIPCSTGACRNLTAGHYGGGCVTSGGGSQCAFAIKYGDGSHTKGVYSKETLTLGPGVTVEGFHFGCVDDQDGPNDKCDGLLWLGGAPESLVVQTSPAYGGSFSYCLPAWNSEAGFLALGSAPSANASGFVFTPMRVEVDTFYVVNLTGISVGGKQLDIPPAVFSLGMIIDSGTVSALATERLRSRRRQQRDGADGCPDVRRRCDDQPRRPRWDFSGGLPRNPGQREPANIRGALRRRPW